MFACHVKFIFGGVTFACFKTIILFIFWDFYIKTMRYYVAITLYASENYENDERVRCLCENKIKTAKIQPGKILYSV